MLKRHAPALLIGAALVAMLAFTWRTWPDPLIDTGRELYTAWRLMEGDALYRDVAWFNGPLSPYVNAAAMLVLGPSLDAIMLTNGLILVAIVLVLYRLLRMLSDRLAATSATVVFVVGFAMLRLLGIGNYTFVTPYAHELTHGTLLLLSMLLGLTRYLLSGSRTALIAASVCAGLACLTKPEVAAAALAGLLIPLALARLRDVLLALAVTSIPVALAFAALLSKLSAAEALAGVTAPFRYALSASVRDQPFYRQVMLGSDVRESIAIAVTVTLVELALLAIGIAAGRVRRRSVTAVMVGIAVAAGLLLLVPSPFLFLFVVRGAPLLLPVAVGVLGWRWWRAHEAITLARLALAIVASVLLVKIALTAGPQHYGFALAMPGAMVLTLAGLAWLPEGLEARGTSGWPLRAVVLGVWAATLPMLLLVHAHRTAELTQLVNAGTADSYRARSRTLDEAMSLLAGYLSARTPPDSTVAVLEQGAWLNFLIQRRNSTPYVTVLPPEVAMFGERAIVDAFARRPPEYIVRIPFTGRYDYQVDGLHDYAPQLDRFVRDRYVNAMPQQLEQLPVALLRRR
ncbi:MAG TPA: hypothetical protein VEO54_00350 [Thermoanaerobaculia bacterium]|nr:hypothetical protein [Thermoanaerobaculia bacterium]